MSGMTSHYPERVFQTDEEEQPRPLRDRLRRSSPSIGWMLVGLAALGLGALAWNHFAPDIRRYLKIRNM